MNSLASRRFFTTALWNYSQAGNPKVYLTLARGGSTIGDLVFELYEHRVPQTVQNFKNMIDGDLKGSSFHKGYPGIVLQGGKFQYNNISTDGTRMTDEDLSMRHHSRGMLTMYNCGENACGTEFMITLGKTDYLDGYNTIFGELVEGHDVLDKAEEATSRLGKVDDLVITDCGAK